MMNGTKSIIGFSLMKFSGSRNSIEYNDGESNKEK
jgi:hypothetical protein